MPFLEEDLEKWIYFAENAAKENDDATKVTQATVDGSSKRAEGQVAHVMMTDKRAEHLWGLQRKQWSA